MSKAFAVDLAEAFNSKKEDERIDAPKTKKAKKKAKKESAPPPLEKEQVPEHWGDLVEEESPACTAQEDQTSWYLKKYNEYLVLQKKMKEEPGKSRWVKELARCAESLAEEAGELETQLLTVKQRSEKLEQAKKLLAEVDEDEKLSAFLDTHPLPEGVTAKKPLPKTVAKAKEEGKSWATVVGKGINTPNVIPNVVATPKEIEPQYEIFVLCRFSDSNCTYYPECRNWHYEKGYDDEICRKTDDNGICPDPHCTKKFHIDRSSCVNHEQVCKHDKEDSFNNTLEHRYFQTGNGYYSPCKFKHTPFE